MRMAILCIVQDGHFIIIEIDFVDKGIDKRLTIFFVVDIATLELV